VSREVWHTSINDECSDMMLSLLGLGYVRQTHSAAYVR